MAIVSAGLDSIRGNSRGASTITQQLVRARLPRRTSSSRTRTGRSSASSRRSSSRSGVTQAYPGETGKQQIITAYLNQNYYGNQSYGVKAAVEGYFGKPLAEITPAEAAIIASLPKSPSNYDLVRNAIEECDHDRRRGRGVPGKADARSSPTTRRSSSGATRSWTCSPKAGPPKSGGHVQPARVPSPPRTTGSSWPARSTPRWLAPHFVWAVRDELTAQAVRRGRDDLRRARARRAADHDDPRPAHPEDRREVGRGGRRSCPHRAEPGWPRPRRSGSTSYPDWLQQPRGQEPPQRRARRARLPDR